MMLIAAIFITSCAKPVAAHHAEGAVSNQSPATGPERVSRYGVACHLWGRSGSLGVGPANYKVSDIGRPSVPLLSWSEVALVARMDRDLPSTRFKSLWFTFLRERGHDEFVVFDTSSVQGDVEPCTYGPPGYMVLSQPGDIYYETGDAPALTRKCCSARGGKPWLDAREPPARR